MDSNSKDHLSQQARERIDHQRKMIPVNPSKLTPQEIEKAYHDLQVYQVELEIQNEELIKTQLMLMEVSEKYQNLYNDAPVGYLTVNLSGLVEEANQTFSAMTGMPTENIKNKSVRNWISKEDSPVYYSHRKKLLRTKQSQTFGLKLQRTDKTCFPAQITLKLDNEGFPNRILMIVQDETDRIMSAEKLARSEQKFRIAAELASDTIYTVDIASDQVTLVSSGFKDIDPGAYAYQNFDTATFLEMLDEEEKSRVRKKIDALYRKGEKFEHVYTLNITGDIKRIVHDRATIFEWEGNKPKTVLGVLSDLTHIHETEMKLQEMNAMKDKFFSIIAHDLKNPFNSIIGFSDLLIEDYDVLTDDERKSMIGKLNKAAIHAFQLLDKLLKWSRIRINRMEQSPAMINLKESINHTLELIQTSAEQKSIRLSSGIPGDLQVFVDQDILQSILRNLLTNAIKFTPKDGSIAVSAVKQGQQMVKICVEDSGVGISDEDIVKVFRVGNKTGKRGTEGESGSGLGLILCREFVHLSGGEISVDSKLGKGSKFCFTLPARKMTN